MMARWALLLALTLAAILIPFFLWGEPLEQWIRTLLESGSARWTVAAALAGLLALDIVLPVPSSLVSTAAGALLGFAGGVLTSWIGMTAGCLLGYWLAAGSKGERLLGEVEVARLRRTQERFGDWMLIVFRAVPVLAEASVIFAGLTRVPLRRFLLITATSNLGISIAYSATGAFFARRESFLLAFAGAIAIPALAMLIARGK